MNENLTKLYYDSPGFPNARELSKLADVSVSDAQKFINKQQVSQLHKGATKKKFYPIFTSDDGGYQADLAFFTSYKKFNSGYHILLVVINVNTKELYVVPLKNKSKDSILEGFDTIIAQAKKHTPITSISNDSGLEFSKFLTTYLKDRNIEHHITPPGNKRTNGVVERVIRTIRELIEKHLTAYGGLRYVDVLPDLISFYNNRKHTSTGFAPFKIGASEMKKIREKQQEKIEAVNENRLEVGDTVRVKLPLSLFDKKSGQKFYKGEYTIHRVNPFSYGVTNSSGDKLARNYKAYELQKIDDVQEAPPREVEEKIDVEKELKKVSDERKVKKEGLSSENILSTTRVRKQAGKGKRIYYVS